jgi:ferric-dicitrate binding protein FerR (iron transport regulator)
MDRATELIERYLDDIATAEERAELAALLAADRSVADALARAARVDARLRHFGRSGREPQALGRAAARQPAPLWRSWKVGAAAAVLLVLGGLLGAVVFFTAHRPEPALQIVSGQLDRVALDTPLEVRGDAPALIRLAGGADAALSAGTRVIVHRPAEQSEIHIALLAGSGTFSVPPDSTALVIDTPGGGVVKGQGMTFTVGVDLAASETGRPEWQITVRVTHGLVEVRHGAESELLTSADAKKFRAEKPPDLVGRVESVSATKRQQVINGVEKLFAETRLALAVRGGAAATPGSRLTVRLTDITRSAGAAGPALGDIVRIWIAPGTADLAEYVEIAEK